MQPSSSDPSMHYAERGPSALGNEYEPSSATSDDEEEGEDSEDGLTRGGSVRNRETVYDIPSREFSGGEARRRRR